MNEKVDSKRVQGNEALANPGACGLMILGVLVTLFAVVEARLLPLPLRGFSLLLLVGGLALLVSGGLEIRRQNGFGAAAFCGYGFFWLSLLTLFIYPRLGLERHFHASMLASYMIMWGLFSAILFLGTLHLSRTLRLTFVLLTAYQLCFAAGLVMRIGGLQQLAGGLGALCGLLFIGLGVARFSGDIRTAERVFPAGGKLG